MVKTCNKWHTQNDSNPQSCTYKHRYKASLNQVYFKLFSSWALYVCNYHIADSILALTQYCLLNSSEYRSDHNSLSSTISSMGCSTVSHVCTLHLGYTCEFQITETCPTCKCVVIQYGHQLLSCNRRQLFREYKYFLENTLIRCLSSNEMNRLSKV